MSRGREQFKGKPDFAEGFRRQSHPRRPCRLRHISAADVPLPSTGPNFFNAEGKTQILEARPESDHRPGVES